MQNKYVGDIGDFGKYGLLRALCGFRDADDRRELPLGIVWYLNPNDNGPGGRHTKYLHKPKRFRPCDPPLFHTLFWIIVANQRNVARIHDSHLFPPDTIFFEEHVPRNDQDRCAWRDQALAKTEASDIVFLDPDNGLASAAAGERPASSRHVCYSELAPYVTRGQTLVIYHHLARQKHVQQVKDRADDLKRKLARPDVWALLFHPYAPRAYFIVPGHDHTTLLNDRIHAFLEGPWGQGRPEGPHFQPILFP